MSAVEEFLSHHGVKGMRWGVRRDRRSSGGGSHSSAPSHPPASSLTDDELKRAIERMHLEQQYTKLISPGKPSSDTETSKFIKDLGKTLTKNAVNAAGNAAINAALKK